MNIEHIVMTVITLLLGAISFFLKNLFDEFSSVKSKLHETRNEATEIKGRIRALEEINREVKHGIAEHNAIRSEVINIKNELSKIQLNKDDIWKLIRELQNNLTRLQTIIENIQK